MAVVPSNATRITTSVITGESCPNPNWCMAVDNSGNVIAYANGTWSSPELVDTPGGGFNGVSCPTTTFCMAVSYLDGYTIWNGATWSPIGFPRPLDSIANSMLGVSCSSAAFCGVNNLGGELTFYVDGVWHQPTTNNGALSLGQSSTPISCVGTWCMYTDNDGNYQTANDLVLSTSHTIPYFTDALTTEVSCTSKTFCVAANTGDYRVNVWNGTTWTPTGQFVSQANINLGVNAVSCIPSQCVVADDSNYYVSTNGSTWSGPVPFDTWAEVTTLSCASTSFCATGDYSGYAYLINPQA
jgi:hypothetical protein